MKFSKSFETSNFGLKRCLAVNIASLDVDKAVFLENFIWVAAVSQDLLFWALTVDEKLVYLKNCRLSAK